MDIERARFNMIEQQIRPWEVLDPGVLELLSVVRREDFVPAAYRSLAFSDMEIPLRAGGARGQVMLAPKIEARMLQEAAPRRHERVLEIGAGSGYMAALLAKRAQQVVTVELEPELVQMARANLARANITNVDVRLGDAALGPQPDQPFDLIVLSGSVAEVPQILLDQLKVGGRLLGIVGEEPIMRATVVRRRSENQWTTTQPWDTVAPRLLHFPEPSHFVF
jgi:protein-L-isoaspartate(D-aspartate) O-methyltransferase